MIICGVSKIRLILKHNKYLNIKMKIPKFQHHVRLKAVM